MDTCPTQVRRFNKMRVGSWKRDLQRWKMMGRSMYAALIPETIKQNIAPRAHRNILRSPSFSPETLSALRRHHMAPANAASETVPKKMRRMRSRFGMAVTKSEINIRTGRIKFIRSHLLPIGAIDFHLAFRYSGSNHFVCSRTTTSAYQAP